MENTTVLTKSEKVSQRKKKRVTWAVSIPLVVVPIVALVIAIVIDYRGYKKGQEYGLASISAALEISNASWINEDDSYTEQCEDVYHNLSVCIPDVRYAFADIMESAGFNRYHSYEIAGWFKYTNIVEYASDYYYYWNISLLIFCSIVLMFSIMFTIRINKEEKKELIVFEDSVLCKVNSKKSKQLVFEDINNVDFGKNTLKIVGTGIKFKISNLTNAENIKSVIIEKKKTAQSKSDSLSINNADELKKYKDLLDNGVISQEEFDAKKKQILGL